MSVLLEATDLAFAFPEKPLAPVFSGVSLRLEEGESLGLQGVNGSGKSTLLRVLASLLRPTRGEVLFRGRPLRERLGEYRAGLNYSQGAPFGFYPRLTGVDNLRFFSGLKDALVSEGGAEDLLRRVGLAEDAWRKPYVQYSLGMKQRLHMARLLLEPCGLLILDEPTNGLDAQGQAALAVLLSGPLKAKAKVIVSHDADFLAEVTGRSLRLGGAPS